MSDMYTVTPMPVIINMSKRMSRLPICAISCAITPRNSAGDSFLIMPCVNAMDASRGVRPVAKAFSDSSGIMYTRGVGRPAAKAVFSTARKISRFCLSVGDISYAPAVCNIMLSPNAHDITIQIAHIIRVGTATEIVVFIAFGIGVTAHVNKKTKPIKMHGNITTSNAVVILLWRI